MSLIDGIELAKQHKYEEALPILESEYKKDHTAFNKWDLYFLGKCLRKVGKMKASLKVSQHVYDQFPDLEVNKNLLSWNLYSFYISPSQQANFEEQQIFEAASYIVEHMDQEQYSSYERTVLTILKYLKQKPNTNYHQMLYWLDFLNPDQLSQHSEKIVDLKGNVRELASPLETWYQYRVRALYEINEYESSIQTADKALHTISKFHYDNDLWIKIKKAASMEKLGDINGAIAELEDVVSKKELWVAYQELFQLYANLENYQKALTNGAFAMLAKSGESKHKIKLMLSMGAVLEKDGDIELALKHYVFVRDIRREQNWKEIEKLNEKIDALEKQVGVVDKDYRKALHSYWRKCKLSNLPSESGKIKKLLSNNKAGFIVAEDGQEYFFKVKNVKNKGRIQENMLVRFYVVQSFDQKKQQKTEEAIEIEIRS